MRAQPQTLLCTLLLLQAACGSGQPLAELIQRAPARSDVQSGSLDTADPAMGMLWRADKKAICSGTLITPSIVLTAAHCVDGATAASLTFYTGTGNGTSISSPSYDPAGDATLIGHGVSQFQTAPGWTLAGCPTTHDLALVQLSSAVYATYYNRYATSAAQLPPPGASLTAIGYGYSTESMPQWIGQKHSGSSTLTKSDAGKLIVSAGPAIADKGDSGGPLLFNGLIVGTSMCHLDGEGPGHTTEYYQRVDVVADWIATTVNSWEQPCLDSANADYQACLADGTPPCSCLSDYYWETRSFCGKGGPMIFCRPTL